MGSLTSGWPLGRCCSTGWVGSSLVWILRQLLCWCTFVTGCSLVRYEPLGVPHNKSCSIHLCVDCLQLDGLQEHACCIMLMYARMTDQLQQIAPTATQLACRLQLDMAVSFGQAFQHLLRMISCACIQPFESPCDIVTDPEALLAIGAACCSICTQDRASSTAGCVEAQEVDVVAWNVRGLQSSMPGVVRLMSVHSPLALVLTETKLQASHATQAWVKNMHPDYDTFSSCFP